jgi:hypothetical protein
LESGEEMDNYIIAIAPTILVIVGILLSFRFFVTPEMLEKRLREKRVLIEGECEKMFATKEEMQIERKKLLEAVASDYLEKAVFEIAQRRIDDKLNNTEKRFDKIDANVEKVNENVQHIIELMIQKTTD